MEVDNDKFLSLFIASRVANQNHIFNEKMLFEFIEICKEKNKHTKIIKNIDYKNLKVSIENFKNNNILYNSEDNSTSIPINIKVTKLINSDFTYWDDIAEFSNDYNFYEQMKLKNLEKKIYIKKRYQNQFKL